MDGLQCSFAPSILIKARLSAWRFTGPCIDFRCLAGAGRFPSVHPLIFGTFHQGKVQEKVNPYRVDHVSFIRTPGFIRGLLLG